MTISNVKLYYYCVRSLMYYVIPVISIEISMTNILLSSEAKPVMSIMTKCSDSNIDYQPVTSFHQENENRNNHTGGTHGERRHLSAARCRGKELANNHHNQSNICKCVYINNISMREMRKWLSCVSIRKSENESNQ